MVPAGLCLPTLVTPAQALQAALAGIPTGWGHRTLLSITLQLGRGTVPHRDPAAAMSCPALPGSSGWGRTKGHPAATGAPPWSAAGFDPWPGPRRRDEEREDAAFPPSAQPCCDKTGNVTWKTPVYSPQRKKIRRARSQGASVTNARVSVRPTGPVLATAPAEETGVGSGSRAGPSARHPAGAETR